MGKGSRLLTVGREWDGKAGSCLVDWTGRESKILGGTGSWNGSGAGRDIGREHSREIGREHSKESVGNIVGTTVGNTVGTTVGNVFGIWPGVAVLNGWEHDRERGLETTNG